MIEQQEILEECRAFVKFSYDATKIAPIVEEIAKEVGKKYTVKGFRKGRASVNEIKMAYRKPILDEAANRLANEAFQDILFENKWKPFGSPNFKVGKIDYDRFETDVVVRFVPPFELSLFETLEVEDSVEVASQDVVTRRMIEQICEERSEKVPFTEDDFLLAGDDAIVNYHGLYNGEEFEHNKEEGLMLSLGKNQVVPQIEEQLIGMKVGDKKEFDVDGTVFGREGGTFHFDTEIVAASKVNPAVFDDALAQQFGLENVQQLSAKVDEQAVEYIRKQKINAAKEKVLDKLVEDNNFGIPVWMVTEAAKSIAQQSNTTLEQLTDEQKQNLLTESERRLRLTFVLDGIKEKEPDTVLSDQELLATIEKNFNTFDPKVREELKKGNQQLLSAVASDVQSQHAIEWIANRVTFVKKESE